MRRVLLPLAGLIVAALVLTLMPVAPASAAIGPPGLVAPLAAANVAANPTFEWTAGTDAVRYVLDVSTSSTMSPTVVSIPTTNLTTTPVADLPVGTLYWRVTAYDQASGGNAAGSGVRSFTKAAVASPALVAPANATTFTHPTVPTFSWSPVAGADRYELLVLNGTMTAVVLQVETDLTSLTPTTLLPLNAPMAWTVRARSTNGTWSAYAQPGRSFNVGFATPTGLTPGVLQSSYPGTPAPDTEQVELVWSATDGATAYEVEIDGVPTTVTVTRYAPPTVPSLTNHLWRVRAKASNGTFTPWSPMMIFKRSWPGATPSTGFGTISLVGPADNDFALREPTFTWTPQRLASRYELTFATDSGFTNVVATETTTKTTWTPGPGTFDPTPSVPYYWSVRGIDDPSGAKSTAPTARRFAYVPAPITQTSPANGTSTYAPVLEWSRSSSPTVGRYRVTITDATGAQVRSIDTYNSAYTPTGLNTAANKNPHTWKVQPLDSKNRPGPLPPTGRTFTVTAPTGLTSSPTPTSPVGASATRVPPLTWTPVTNATSYTVRYRLGGFSWNDLATGVTSPAFAPTDDGPYNGSYEWQVEAYNGFLSLGTGATSTFSVTSLPTSVPVSPANCTLSDPCPYLNDQPTLDWDPVAGATHYRLYIAHDQNFTNPVGDEHGIVVPYSRYTPTTSITGGSYYWYARPCAGIICGVEAYQLVGTPSVRAWKQSFVKLPRLTPIEGSTQSGSQVTFTWTGWLQANQAMPVGERVEAEARSYIVELYTNAGMTTKIHTSPPLDATTYTINTAGLPDGTIHWRVFAVDGTNNELQPNASPLGTFVKPTTTAPALITPAAAATVAATPTLSWAATPFAGNYQVEVYKDLAQPLSGATRVFSATVPTPAATPIEALPAGEYGWRVRAFNAVTGTWGYFASYDNTTIRRFTIAGPATTLSAPANAAAVNRNRLRFTWAAVPAATRSRIEVSTTNTFATTVLTADTVANGWSPTAALATGTYWWRVRTLDANGNPIGTSAAWSFSAT